MSSKDCITKVGAYLDGELPEAERLEMESHVRGCAECTRAAESFRRLDEIAGRQSVPPVTGEEWARVWEGILARRDAGEGLPVPDEAATRRMRAAGRTRAVFEVLRGTVFRGVAASPRRRLGLGIAAAAAVLMVALILGWPRGGPSGGNGGDDMSRPPPSSEAKTEDYAKHLEGPPPEIIVDPDEGATHLRYDDSF